MSNSPAKEEETILDTTLKTELQEAVMTANGQHATELVESISSQEALRQNKVGSEHRFR